MSDKTKVWVLDPVESIKRKSRAGKRDKERTMYSPDERAQGPGARGRRESERESIDEKGSPILTLLAYLAGPYAILTTRRGRESRFWVSLAILSCIAGMIIILRWNSIFAGPHDSGTGFLIWMSLACLASLMGFITWARAVFLVGRYKGRLLWRLPAWIGHPGTAGILGFIVPGFGLFIAEHPRRAATALLTACATAISALVLWQAPELWRLSHVAGPLAGHGDLLERVFLAMGVIGSIGAFAWVVQALDGARLAGYRMGSPARPRGDWAAVALAVAIVALVVTFKPSHVAETLDRFAVSMREDGLRVIPLYASYAAMRLDPSQPVHAVRAIEMNEALGRPGEAQELRRELAERWRPYERMLRLEASAVDNAVLGPEKP